MNEATKRAREKRARENPCDICGGDAGLIHEVARGIHRQKALLANYATLILCGNCHDLKVHKGMPVAEQLAYIHLRRPMEFDMPRFYALTGRVWPSLTDIDAAYAKLWNTINRRIATP